MSHSTDEATDQMAGTSNRNSMQLMYEVCRAALEIDRQATSGQESYDPALAFEQVMSGLSLSQSELTRLWALFLLASRVAKSQYESAAQKQ